MSSFSSLRWARLMMCHVTVTSRTFSTSSMVREVIQANGQRGSNQKSTLLMSTNNPLGPDLFRSAHQGAGDHSARAETRSGRDPVTTGPVAPVRVAGLTPRVAGSPHAWNQPH